MKKGVLILFMICFASAMIACEPIVIENDEEIIISLNPGIDTVELESSFEDAGATASYGETELEVIVISNTVDVSEEGAYEVVYETSYLGETKTITRKVTVVDDLLPIVTLNPGQDTIYVGDEWVDAGVYSTEFMNVYRTGNVDINTPGEYLITYRITGRGGAEVFLYRYVNVIER
ncbi:hypothetical protein BK010_02860 [Tenericutes bacterium MO-XQ]|nr:hypothetical protein BK010_02860 [Tenericutes bacterium MO-XQ]